MEERAFDVCGGGCWQGRGNRRWRFRMKLLGRCSCSLEHFPHRICRDRTSRRQMDFWCSFFSALRIPSFRYLGIPIEWDCRRPSASGRGCGQDEVNIPSQTAREEKTIFFSLAFLRLLACAHCEAGRSPDTGSGHHCADKGADGCRAARSAGLDLGTPARAENEEGK